MRCALAGDCTRFVLDHGLWGRLFPEFGSGLRRSVPSEGGPQASAQGPVEALGWVPIEAVRGQTHQGSIVDLGVPVFARLPIGTLWMLGRIGRPQQQVRPDRVRVLVGRNQGQVFGAQAPAQVQRRMDVRSSGEGAPAAALSGGNLQKFVVGRELDARPRLLVIDQPTWGVDAGAAANIRQAIVDLAAQGTAVLVISQDLDELFEVADRIAVMASGRLSAA